MLVVLLGGLKGGEGCECLVVCEGGWMVGACGGNGPEEHGDGVVEAVKNRRQDELILFVWVGRAHHASDSRNGLSDDPMRGAGLG